MHLRILGLMTFTAATLGLSVGQLASAADIPSAAQATARRPIVAVYNWSGWYIGGSVGGGWGRSEVDFAAGGVFPNRERFNTDGVIGGGHVGYQVQSNQWVFGIEGSFHGTSIRGSTVDQTFPAAIMLADIDWIATVRGRLGFAQDRWHFYGTGGYAYARIFGGQRHVTAPGIPGFTISETAGHNGWVIGAGLEYALMANLILGVEYLHFDFGSVVHSGANSLGFATLPRRHSLDADLDVVQARLTFKFGP